MLDTLSALAILINKTQNPLTLGLLGQKNLAPRENDGLVVDYFDKNLNEYQKDAVKFSLGSSIISLIHGPPGMLIELADLFTMYDINCNWMSIMFHYRSEYQ